jgi:hypothetical protein
MFRMEFMEGNKLSFNALHICTMSKAMNVRKLRVCVYVCVCVCVLVSHTGMQNNPDKITDLFNLIQYVVMLNDVCDVRVQEECNKHISNALFTIFHASLALTLVCCRYEYDETC